MEPTFFSTEDTAPSLESKPKAYKVLARKYRPKTFVDLIGQKAMVQTLTHALQSDRLAHAYMLTGIRGVGKTTTARIIARALNCTGPEGTNTKPTSAICGVCDSCISIGEDRHPDVMEMDAASRTGVDDIRDIIEGVQYRPIQSRYKVYIIDEVHMLSKQAFNALLKTLEEPPAHVKFIFATTEIRRVPVTILSRCQRFDLKRMTPQVLSEHLQKIAQAENVQVEGQALSLLTRAAEGSMRDGLSLLDQAIAHIVTESNEFRTIDEEAIKTMLGLADYQKIVDLYEKVVQGAVDQALVDFQALHLWGADPILIIQDLVELTHVISKLKVAPQSVETILFDQQALGRLQQWAKELSIPFLSRAWQILTKGLSDMSPLTQSQAHAEMLLIRLAFLSDKPTPDQLLDPVEMSVSDIKEPGRSNQNVITFPKSSASLKTIEDLIDWLKEKRQPLLVSYLTQDVEILNYNSGHITLALRPTAPVQLTQKLKTALDSLTGINWSITVHKQTQGQTTLKEKQEALSQKLEHETMNSAEAKAILDLFPGAELVNVYPTNKTE